MRSRVILAFASMTQLTLPFFLLPSLPCDGITCFASPFPHHFNRISAPALTIAKSSKQKRTEIVHWAPNRWNQQLTLISVVNGATDNYGRRLVDEISVCATKVVVNRDDAPTGIRCKYRSAERKPSGELMSARVEGCCSRHPANHCIHISHLNRF